MAKKNAYEDVLDKLISDNESDNEDESKSKSEGEIQDTSKDEGKTVYYTAPVQKDDQQEEPLQTLTEYVGETLKKIELDITSQSSKGRFKKGAKKLKHPDIYGNVTWTVRRRISDLVNLLVEESGMTKYEVIDTLLLNGLKNTNFEE